MPSFQGVEFHCIFQGGVCEISIYRDVPFNRHGRVHLEEYKLQEAEGEKK